MNRPQSPVRCGCLKEKNLLSSVGRNSLPYDFDGNKYFPVKDTPFIIKCTDTLSCICAFLQRETKIRLPVCFLECFSHSDMKSALRARKIAPKG